MDVRTGDQTGLRLGGQGTARDSTLVSPRGCLLAIEWPGPSEKVLPAGVGHSRRQHGGMAGTGAELAGRAFENLCLGKKRVDPLGRGLGMVVVVV